MKDTFERIFKTNEWKGDESVSGQGSDLYQTDRVRRELPKLLNRLGVETMLDIPCGDFYWMNYIPLPDGYVGADIVPELIEQNQERYPGVVFELMDITESKLPEVDLILCRDLLGHFSNADVKHALQNLRASRSLWLLATTFPDHEYEGDIETGHWRPINLASYFGLPDPILLINEGCTEGGGKFADKSLGLWRL